MLAAIPTVPAPVNEPVRTYAPGTSERARLATELTTLSSRPHDLACVIDGRAVTAETRVPVVMPHRHRHVLGEAHFATPAITTSAIESALRAAPEWSSMSFHDRAAVFLRAADLLAGPWRATLNAATMFGQSKTCHQAEIDAACELIDFLRFNVSFAHRLLAEQPVSSPGVWNMLEARPLEGFVFAVTPFNFTAIAANLPTAPALMGNTVVWKPSTTQALSAHFTMELLAAAGLPPGVINLVHGAGADVGDVALAHRDLAGVHFTGSTGTFNAIWKTIGNDVGRYRSYPRVVGETGGKDFIVAHASADVDALAVAIVRGGFEYQGQKCSAASRVYVPKGLWPRVRERVAAMLGEMRVGDVSDFGNFMGAVIDARAFARHRDYLAHAKHETGTYAIVAGGTCDDTDGYFVQPTLVETNDPRARLMREEIFGPVVTVFAYEDGAWDETLKLVDETSPYALTGAVFARDRSAISQAREVLRHAAGNFYVNDKPTGAVVGQQPFGGARASGTNDKAGSVYNLVRWISPRTVKETFDPPTDWRYPFLANE